MTFPDELWQRLARIDELRNLDPESASLERLGGMTNRNFHLKTPDGEYAVRIAGDGTDEYIDRSIEAHNARAAARAEVNAEVVYFDVDSGLMVTRFIDDGETMSPEKFCTVPGAPERAGRVLRRMHESGETFRFRFELFSMIDDYLQVLEKEKATLPDGYHDAMDESEQVREVLNFRPVALRPCHCDPLTENFIDTGDRMWLLDWEYSGMNDPLWDLGDLSVEAGFDSRHDEEMLQAYMGGMVTDAVLGRMVLYKAMCDLLWTLWGLIQHAHDNPAEDFWAYAIERFERCRQLLGSADFNMHLKAVREDRS